MQKKKCNT